jgi:NADH:ubiquinone oxidoreductase subunit F (NADH-binding)
MAGLLTAVASGSARRSDLRQLDRFAGQVEGRGACHHPDGAVRLVRTALAVFAADLRRHLSDGPCPGALRPTSVPVPEVG